MASIRRVLTSLPAPKAPFHGQERAARTGKKVTLSFVCVKIDISHFFSFRLEKTTLNSCFAFLMKHTRKNLTIDASVNLNKNAICFAMCLFWVNTFCHNLRLFSGKKS